MRLVLALLLAAAAAAAAIEVVRIQVPFEEEYSVLVNASVEYILEFIPSGAQAWWPARLRARAAGPGISTAGPLLLTARQSNGAQTWQLPYRESGAAGDAEPLFELERTLCFDPAQSESSASGQFSVHVSGGGETGAALALLARPALYWRLPFDQEVEVTATQTAPVSVYYQWLAGQESARLVLGSRGDVCALVGVHNYTCPVAETTDAIPGAGLYMTMQRSGGVHVSRRQFPEGFYVSAAVLPTDEPCAGADAGDPDWLYEAVLGGDVTTPPPLTPHRNKTFTLTVQAALTRGEYAVAAVVLLLLFLALYGAFLALVLAERLPAWQRLIAPRAVLAVHEGNIIENEAQKRRRRRNSDATFDSVDDDSEGEEEAPAQTPPPAQAPPPAQTSPPAQAPPPAADNPAYSGDVTHTTDDHNQITTASTATDQSQTATDQNDTQAPFGLPARLHVAALSRRRERVLRARSDRYLSALYTVALFYALPVVQFLATFQIVLNVSGSLDLCYYNFLCAHPFGALSDFNHVWSNIGYLLLGALFMLQVRRRRARRRRQPRHQEYGIPAHYGLLSSLGAAMMVVAVLSASYHVCPNGLNFQFDTSFMYVLAVLCMVKMYQARHPDINARAHATFAVLALIIALMVWGVVGGGALFWSVFTVLHVFTFLLLSLRIYYLGQFRLESGALAEAARGLAHPLYASRLAMLVVANAANWAFALYGLVTMAADFATHLLMVLLMNALLHMVFYLLMKLAHGERPRWYAWVWLGAAAGAWAPALYFFTSGSSSWAATPAQSRHLNHSCRALRFYDAHDLWHALSALALYCSFNAMLTWDDGLSAVKRTDIAVF